MAETGLTADRKRIRELEDRLAKTEASRYEKGQDTFRDQPAGESVVLHFIEDGFTASGRVWYRGQELEFVTGSPANQ